MLIENQPLALCGLLLCTAGFLYFAARYIGAGREYDLRLALCALGPAVGACVFARVAYYEGSLFSARYDLFVYRWDVGELSFRLGQLLLPWGLPLLAFLYGLLPASVMLALLVNERVPKRPLIAFALNFALAPLLYAVFPVCGPVFAFPEFPHLPSAFTPHVFYSHVAPNGVPSVHMSTALLAVWYCRSSRWASTAAWINLCGVIVSTLASGEHYVFDLIVAVPYAAFAVWAAELLKSRRDENDVLEGAAVVGGGFNADDHLRGAGSAVSDR